MPGCNVQRGNTCSLMWISVKDVYKGRLRLKICNAHRYSPTSLFFFPRPLSKYAWLTAHHAWVTHTLWLQTGLEHIRLWGLDQHRAVQWCSGPLVHRKARAWPGVQARCGGRYVCCLEPNWYVPGSITLPHTSQLSGVHTLRAQAPDHSLARLCSRRSESHVIHSLPV